MTFKFISLVALAIGGILALSATGNAQEAILVIRHSDPPSLLSLDEILDETPLSESGLQRAQMLAERLKDVGISAIFATDTVRTQQTAAPLAETLGLQVQIHPWDDTDGLVALLRSEHQGERVLVVGHWSTIPLNLFVVIPSNEQAPTVLHLHY